MNVTICFAFGLSFALVLFYFAFGYKSLGLPTKSKWSKPFFGGLIDIVSNWERLLDFLLGLQKEFNYKTVGIPGPRLGSIPGGVIIVWSPENVKHILSTNFLNYEKGKNVNDALADFLGDGIFDSDGETWRYHRKVASRMFSSRLMRSGTQIALNNVKEVLNYVDKKIDRNEAFDLAHVFFQFTMDTFAEIAFGEKLRSLDCPHPFARAFDRVQYLSEKRFRNPLWKFQRWFPFNEQQEIRKNITIMDDFAIKVISRIKSQLASNPKDVAKSKKGSDLVTRFIIDAKSQKQPEPTSKELRDIVMNVRIVSTTSFVRIESLSSDLTHRLVVSVHDRRTRYHRLCAELAILQHVSR